MQRSQRGYSVGPKQQFLKGAYRSEASCKKHMEMTSGSASNCRSSTSFPTGKNHCLAFAYTPNPILNALPR